MLKRLEIVGFKSFAKKTILDFSSATTAIVGPNGSGKSNVAEAFRFALGEQSMKSMRGKRSEDLIFNGSHSIPRANRASVAIVFDNAKRAFKIDFDEVTIERVILRDGTSDYLINGSKVRLRDVAELLASGNIGETGHHIISQGEADRILIANARERRAMLEDALGLKLYEFKKQEAQRKLEKTRENIAQVQSLRRELAPHLRFLETQVKKLERADEVRGKLVSLAQTYFAIEDAYLAQEERSVAVERAGASTALIDIEAALARIADPQALDRTAIERSTELAQAESKVATLSAERSTLSLQVGRIEGALAEISRYASVVAREPYAKVPREEIEALHHEIEAQTSIVSQEPAAFAAALVAIRTAMRHFFARYRAPASDRLTDEEEAAKRMERERAEYVAKLEAVTRSLEEAETIRARAREAMVALEERSREDRRRILTLAEAKATEDQRILLCNARAKERTLRLEELERDKAEVLALAGAAAMRYEAVSSLPAEDRHVQNERKLALERMKIRLEESGGSGEDVRHEYKEATDREAFLTRELTDLDASASGLEALIHDLETELSKSFNEGLTKVNASFAQYFALMFGGGSARLVLEEPEDEEAEEEIMDAPRLQLPAGIEISVNLPKKKIRSLVQLSGGERALTSIALIFAMSQVNPPPFLILDETDAALDEANSRRYGDMIENLAQKSQLIVITHNRETMSRTNVLYGVTMSADGSSKLLSVKFDEAVAVAK